MSAGFVPETGFAQGASGPDSVYDTSPTGLGLSPAYLASSSASASASGGGAGGSSTTGVVSAFAGSAAPAGTVLCDGSTYDGTTVTYAALYAVIGTTYGGTGIAAFKVPDLRGRVIAGYAASGGHTDVATLGNNDGVAAANRRPKHVHTSTPLVNGFGGGGTQIGSGAIGNADGTTFTPTGSFATTALAGTNSVDTAAYIVLNYIIAL